MRAYLDTREGKFAVYVMDENQSCILHSGQHDSRLAALTEIKEQTKRIIRRGEDEVVSAQHLVVHFTKIKTALEDRLWVRDP